MAVRMRDRENGENRKRRVSQRRGPRWNGWPALEAPLGLRNRVTRECASFSGEVDLGIGAAERCGGVNYSLLPPQIPKLRRRAIPITPNAAGDLFVSATFSQMLGG